VLWGASRSDLRRRACRSEGRRAGKACNRGEPRADRSSCDRTPGPQGTLADQERPPPS